MRPRDIRHRSAPVDKWSLQTAAAGAAFRRNTGSEEGCVSTAKQMDWCVKQPGPGLLFLPRPDCVAAAIPDLQLLL